MPSPGHTARKILEYRILVEGTGEFPFDMLRYDCCYPATEEDSRAMAGEVLRGKRTIQLIVRSANGKPTPDRWASFGWKLIGILSE